MYKILYKNQVNRIVFLFVLVFILEIILSKVFAQQLLNDTILLDEVMVTGTKVAVARNQIPLSVSVIEETEIESSSESALLPVLSQHVPGLFITERGITGFGVATGSAGQISLRGIGGSPSTQVLVMLNGSPQYMGLFGHPLADAYIASDVKRVEVIRGPASTLYGSNAMGGVINIITKDAQEEGIHANGRLMYGAYNTQKYMANVSFKKEKFQGFVSINHDKTDGHRDSSEFKITNGYARFEYALTPELKAAIDLSIASFYAMDPGLDTNETTPALAGSSIDILRGMGSFVLENKSDISEGALRLFYNFGEHNISDGFHSNDINYGLSLFQGLKIIRDNTISIGMDMKNFGGNAENKFAMNGRGISFVDTTINEIAGYILVQQQLRSKIMVNAGFRLEHNEHFGFEPVPSAGVSYSPSQKTTFKTSVSKGFRSPTIRELFMWKAANPNLLPEKMMNYDISLKQILFDTKLSTEISVFHANGSNLIQSVYSEGIIKNLNSGEFSNFGIEVALNYIPMNSLKLHMNYSFLEMDKPILASPNHKLFISGTYYFRNIIFNLNGLSISNLYLLTGAQPLTESYTLINAKIAFKVKKYASIFVKGQNLTNQKYQINYGYPMPGIVGFAGINISI
jgi:iron complex outermembrane receptor protein